MKKTAIFTTEGAENAENAKKLRVKDKKRKRGDWPPRHRDTEIFSRVACNACNKEFNLGFF